MEFISELDAQKTLEFEDHAILKKPITVQPTKNKNKSTEPQAHFGSGSFINPSNLDLGLDNVDMDYTESMIHKSIYNFETSQLNLDSSGYHLAQGDLPNEHFDAPEVDSYFVTPLPKQLHWPSTHRHTSIPNFLHHSINSDSQALQCPLSNELLQVSQPAKSKRWYKLFYKQLKRPHIKARAVKKQDSNYFFHASRFFPPFLSRLPDLNDTPVPRRIP